MTPSRVLLPSIVLETDGGEIILFDGGMESKVQIPAAPISVSDWKQIIPLLNFQNEYEASLYWVKVVRNLDLKSRANFLEAYKGKSGRKIEEQMEALSGLSPKLIALLKERNINLRALLQMNEWDESSLSGYAELFAEEFVKGNLVREMVAMLHEVGDTTRKKCLEELRAIRKETNEKGYRYIGNRYRDVVERYRYPQFARVRKESGQLLADLRKGLSCEVDTHPFFEDRKVRFSFSVESREEFEKILRELSEEQSKDTLEELLIYLGRL